MAITTSINYHFAEFITDLAKISDDRTDDRKLLWNLAFLLSYITATGDVCVYLDNIENKNILDILDVNDDTNVYKIDYIPHSYTFPDRAEIEGLIARTELISNESEILAPIIYDNDGRLYMQKNYHYETVIVDRLGELMRGTNKPDIDFVKKVIDRLCGETSESDEIDWQRIAVALSLIKRFVVITGGPGTGKTTTAAKIMAAILTIAKDKGVNKSIAICAPTGKAASRLSESIANQVKEIAVDDDIRERIPKEASTIHRLLGYRWLSNNFKHNAQNPMPYDVIIIDESSMVSMSLFAKILDAMSDTAQLIILGDKDQLASVEAGHIFGDVCGREGLEYFSQETATVIRSIAGQRPYSSENTIPIIDSIVELKKNWRFKEAGSIGQLATAIKEGNFEQVKEMLSSKNPKNITIDDKTTKDNVGRYIANNYAEKYYRLVDVNKIKDAGEILDSFCILCAMNVGPFGSEHIDSQIKERVKKENEVPKSHEHFDGMPVMILQNDNHKRLFNGEIGVIKPSNTSGKTDNTDLRFFIRNQGSEFQEYFIHQIPRHRSVYAMTIHKSQGSEFNEIVVVLPDEANKIMTKELFYTAISRAKECVHIIGKMDIIEDLMKKQIHRDSGLKGRLSGKTLT